MQDKIAVYAKIAYKLRTLVAIWRHKSGTYSKNNIFMTISFDNSAIKKLTDNSKNRDFLSK